MKKINSIFCAINANCTRKIESMNQSVTSFLSVSKQKRPIYALDGVRAVACLCVISFHLNLFSLAAHIWSPLLDDVGATVISSVMLAGEMGVLLFFLLSGFLLFLPFAKSIIFNKPRPSLCRYYVRRVFRILPGYYVALLLMTLYLQPLYLQPAHLHELWLFLSFRMDFPQTYQQINPPFWTLAIEFQFYLVLPPLAWVIGKFAGKGTVRARVLKMIACLFVLLTWGLATRYWGFLLTSDTHPRGFVPFTVIINAVRPYIFGTSGKYFEIFAIGMLTAVVYLYLESKPLTSSVNIFTQLLSPYLFALGILIVACANLWHYYVVYVHGVTLHYLDAYQYVLVDFKDVFNPVTFALGYGLCLFAILRGPLCLRRPFEWVPLRWIGMISYSLYIWHDPFILVFQVYLLSKFQVSGWPGGAQYIVFAFWVIVTVFPLSITFYRWIEVPGMRLGERICSWLEERNYKDKDTECITVTIPEIRKTILTTSNPLVDSDKTLMNGFTTRD